MSQKILIVEDDLVFRNYLYQVLKYEYDVFAVPGPLEALETLKHEPYSLMITDLRMPDMDGRALVEKVRAEIDPDIMVIVITAFEDDWPMDEAMSTHVFRYLRKGAFLPSELKQNVDKALEMRGSIVSLHEYKRRADISETIYKDVFDNSTDALFVTDIHLRPVALNRRFEELSGYTIDDLRDKTLFDIITDDDRQYAIDTLNGQIRGEPPGSIAVHVVTKDQTVRHIKVWARVMKDVKGMTNAVFCIARDLSHAPDRPREEVKAESLEARLEEASRNVHSLERKFQRLTEYAKDIIIWMDDHCTCEFVNSEVERTLGYSREELLGRKFPWKDIVHPEEYPVVEKWRDLAKNRIPSHEGEIRVYSKKRFMHYLSYRLSFDYGVDGSCTGFVVVAEDITQQKVAEQELKNANRRIQEFNDRLANGINKKIKALRESEERCKSIVEGTSDIIFSLDSQARIVFMNRAGLSTINMTQKEVYGRNWKDFINDEASVQRMQEIIDAIEEHLSHEPFEMSIETPAGKRFYKANIIKIRDNSRHEIVCVARDISDEFEKNKRLQLLAAIE
ncbi:MAG: PAS domain S-box protein, partial [Desulfomonilia bacterium]